MNIEHFKKLIEVYDTSYGLVYPYVQGRDGKFIRTDIYPAPAVKKPLKTVNESQSQTMEFI